MNTAILLSGGVDSSVAAFLAKQKYTNLTAYYLKIWLEEETQFLGECPWQEDMEYASAVCDQLDIPLKVIPLQTSYYQRVVSYTISELKSGRTPSPDIFCNQRVKFGAFLEEVPADRVISGHYATAKDGHLYKAKDKLKDQTYFLSHMSREQLLRCEFPIGVYDKSEVRAIAERENLAPKSRKDSQGICFLGKIKYDAFVKHHLGEKIGDIIEKASQKKLGTHNGFWFHTIGQRKGLGLSGGPWFVCEKDTQNNIVYVAHGNSKTSFQIDNIHWIQGESTGHLTCKLRHGAKLFDCQINKSDAIRYDIEIAEPDSGIAPGQFCILYKDSECLGGGRIV